MKTPLTSGMRAAAAMAGLFLALFAAACTVVVDENPPPRPGPQFCTREFAPVCGVRDGERRDFANQCVAESSGFRVINRGECRGRPIRPPQACPDIYEPVCGVRPGSRRQTFDNSCEAEAEGYQVIQGGQCRSAPRPGPGPVICPQIYAPVCARQGSVLRTFSNQCVAEGSGFSVIDSGPC